MTRRANRLARVTAALATLTIVSASALGVSRSAFAARPLASAAGASTPGAGSWRSCPGASGSGGAFDVRALRLSCRDAALVTGDGLEPSAGATRVGAFRCRRTHAAETWRYTCLRRDGRQGLAFRTY